MTVLIGGGEEALGPVRCPAWMDLGWLPGLQRRGCRSCTSLNSSSGRDNTASQARQFAPRRIARLSPPDSVNGFVTRVLGRMATPDPSI